jgi:hypothetical protein
MGGIINAVGKVVSSVLGFSGGKAPAAPAPVVSTPTVMPTADSAAVLAAKRRAQQAATQRQGRVSTVLSQENQDTFGG